MGIMDASVLWSLVYFINLQTRQIPATNHHFSCEKSVLLCGSRFLKKKIIFSGWKTAVSIGWIIFFSSFGYHFELIFASYN